MNFDQIIKFAESQASEKLSLEEIKGVRKAFLKAMRDHEDYVKRETPDHVLAKKEAVRSILTEIMGLNKAYTVAKKFIKEGKIELVNLAKKDDRPDFSETQVAWALRSITRVKGFMPAEKADPKNRLFMPQDILDALVLAGTLGPVAFTNKQLAIDHDAKQAKAKNYAAQAA